MLSRNFLVEKSTLFAIIGYNLETLSEMRHSDKTRRISVYTKDVTSLQKFPSSNGVHMACHHFKDCAEKNGGRIVHAVRVWLSKFRW